MAITEVAVQRSAAAVQMGATRPPARSRFRRAWLFPTVTIAVLGFLFFGGLYLTDVLLVGGSAVGVLDRFVAFDPGMLTDAVPALGMTLVAVLGIMLTVVAIIVQLSSDRYTGVALMFMRDPVNISVMTYFVVASLCAIALSVSLHEDFVPRTALVVVMLATGFGLALMLPYFAYVFWFLEPGNIIDRIRQEATRRTAAALASDDPNIVARKQERVLNLMEEITDIANNSIDGRDKIIASRAVDALRDYLLAYLHAKPSTDHVWFQIGRGIRENPDFVAMDTETLHELELRWSWVEWKVLRQYLGVYNEALSTMQDINYLIAIDTRYIGEAAADKGDSELVDMVFRFMNSYLRSAINARGVRAAYNVLHQYRMFVEHLLRTGHDDAAREGVRYMKYYGHVAFDDNLTFITETVAYDLAALCQYAHERGTPHEDRMLKQFLDLDRPTRGYRQQRGLRGVRKAQTKLAAYYLSAGAEDKAKMIADDMLTERADLLHSIRDELAAVESRHFWEIVDRGRNFEYLPPEHRAQLAAFFTRLDAAPPPRRRATDQ